VVAGKKVKVFNTIDAIGKESIDSIADDAFFTYGYFKTLETSRPFNITLFYLAVYDKDKIVAVAPCYVDLNDQFFTLEDKYPFMRKIMNLANRLGFYPNRLIVCTSPNSFHSRILLGKNAKRKVILDLIFRKIDDICRKERIFFSSLLFVSEFEGFLIRNLQDFGYLKFPSANTLYLDIKWSSFDDYLKSLESHKIRTNVRREIRKCQQNEVTIAEEDEYGKLSTTLSNLHSNLFSKYNKGKVSPHQVSFFRKLSEYAKDKTKVFVARRRGKILGFSLCLQHKGVLDVHLCGFDYDAQKKSDYTYFNIAYYRPIKLAIEEGIKKIHFSISSERVKLKRGCKLEETYSFNRCHIRLLNFFYSFYAKKKYSHYNAY